MKMSVSELVKKGYFMHHVATWSGYTRVDDIGTVEPYKGRFGEGFIRYVGQHYCNLQKKSTRYQDIQYWVKYTTSLNVGDKVQMKLTPCSAFSAGRSSYTPYLRQWHVHFTDVNGVEYYWLTTAEQAANELMQKIGTAVEMKFIVSDIYPSEHCIRIKNVRIA